MIRVNIAQIRTHPNTSKKVCQSLSLSNNHSLYVLSSYSPGNISSSSWDIFLRKIACWPAWYLTLAASYRNKKEKQKAIANSRDCNPDIINVIVHRLEAIPLCTLGNHPAPRRDVKSTFLFMSMSTISLIHWIITHTNRGIHTSGSTDRYVNRIK